MKSYSELKELAKQHMKGSTGTIICSFLLYMVLAVATSWIPFGGWLILPPLMMGLYMQIFELEKGNMISIGDLFKGFEKFVPSVLSTIIVGLISIPFSLVSVFSVLSLLASFNETNLTLTLILMLIVTILTIISTLFIYILTSQTFFIIADKNLNAIESIKLSFKLSKNNKLKILFLDLSFILWYLLCMITFGIAFIWVSPYVIMTKVQLYLDLKEQYELENNIKNETL